jgi:hypothetical protein
MGYKGEFKGESIKRCKFQRIFGKERRMVGGHVKR